jgi:transglutaminase-like putative cysteine protease
VSPRSLSFEQLLGIIACLALALIAHLGSLPAWVLVTVALCAGVRLLLARRGRAAPPHGVRLVAAGLAIALLFTQYHTFNGLTAGTALLALMAGLKLLETDNQRDIYVVTLIIYFVSMAALLEGNSFWLLAYLFGVCWLTTATLLRLVTTRPVPDWRPCLRYGGRILGQALPLALVFWLFFPRFAGPLWHIPDDGRSAAGSGLSDSMSPGDIDHLALSDEVAFRVHFAAATPPPQERYWRGPVMHNFDGRKWSHAYSTSQRAPPLQPQGPAYRYTVSLEPHPHRWIYALDWPSHWDLPGGILTGDYTLVQRDPVSRPIDVVATSYTRVLSAEPLGKPLRESDTRRPTGNPRTLQLAQTLRSTHPDDADYVQAVLSMFTQQAFYYTLTPPKLADNSVDAFLFDTKRGFCEHYASAFATLMRAAGIPAHVVTGYQGGTFNRFADYWIVRQSDAHAWDEIWIDGRGWLRVDPTSAVAPARVEQGADEAMNGDEPQTSRWQRGSPWLRDARLRLDALRQMWREQILFFDQNSQQKMLEWLRIPEPDGQKLVLVLAGALSVVLCWLTWQVRREIDPTRKALLIRAYARLCAKIAALGMARRPHEGAEDYAVRVAQHRPDLGPAVSELCRHYSRLRYTAATSQAAVGEFDAAVRAFRPRQSATPQDSRGS